jgi:hypothetical protein
VIVFVTGPRGAGKTTFCELLFRYLTVEAPVSGGGKASLALLSRRQPDDKGYDLEIFQSRPPGNAAAGLETDRIRRPLARRSDVARDWTGDTLGPWVFSDEAFGLAEERVTATLESLERGGLLLIDEVGPLELKLGGGYSRILPRIAVLPRVVVVVRPGLIASLGARLNSYAGAPVLIEVEPGTLDNATELRRLLRRAEEALG